MAKGKNDNKSKSEVQDTEPTIETKTEEKEVTASEQEQKEEQADTKDTTENAEDKKENADEKTGKTENESSPENTAAKKDSEEPQPPPQPPRPLSEFQKSQLTLTEAFPSVEANVVRAVLIAASGQVDPAFNGLLSLTDPEYKLDEASVYRQASQYTPPPPPPVPKGVLRNSQNPSRYRAPPPGPNAQQQQRATAYASAAATIRNDRSQIEEDERLARLLAEQERVGNGGQRRVRYADTGLGPEHIGPDDYSRRGSATRRHYQDDDERSFFDDELPQIKENIAKGLQETKENLNNWFGSLRKKMDLEEPNFFGGLLNNKNDNNRRYSGEDDDLYEDYGRRRTNEQYNRDYNRGYQSGPARARAREEQRNLNDGFEGISMTNHDDDEEELKPKMPPRPESGSATITAVPAADKKIPLKSTGTTEEEDPFFIGDSEDEEEEVPLGEQIISKPKTTTATSTTTAVDDKAKSDESASEKK
ncbi:hypothetical protein DV452_002281 [Geotrichum candidum]|nr:hypothetical protein DV452_002281 [Geotrichum candidum]KAI8131260.1 hypothetical protein DUD61_005077 [Geotrichum candidum]KAI9210219.1 hypothetical protein DS838_004896 [Geotrichum bryndzae]